MSISKKIYLSKLGKQYLYSPIIKYEFWDSGVLYLETPFNYYKYKYHYIQESGSNNSWASKPMTKDIDELGISGNFRNEEMSILYQEILELEK